MIIKHKKNTMIMRNNKNQLPSFIKRFTRKIIIMVAGITMSYGILAAQDEYVGAELVSQIPLGLIDSDVVWNFSSFQDTLFLTVWGSDQLLKVSTITNQIADGYPVGLSNCNLIHSNYVDANGVMWAFDLNNNQINKYATDNTFIESIPIGQQPVNGIEADGILYVVDRYDNTIYMLNMETNIIEGDFSFAEIATVSNAADMVFYDEIFYMVSSDFSGILTFTYDGVDMSLIETENWYSGLSIQGDTIFAVRAGKIDVLNMDGELLNQIDMEDDGIETAIDVFIKNDLLYVAGANDNMMLVYDLPSNQVEMRDYTLPEALSVDYVDAGVAMRIEITVPQGTNMTNLTPTFTLSEGAVAYNYLTSEIEESGVNAYDFSMMPTSYLVIAEDGNSQVYTAIVSEAGVNYQNLMLNYQLPGQISSVIDNDNDEILVEVPMGTDLTALISSFEVSDGAMPIIFPNDSWDGVLQVSGETSNDFSDTLVFTVVNHSQTDLKAYNIIVSYAMGIQSSSEDSFSVYPNPTTNVINFRNGNNISNIVIMNTAGCVLQVLDKLEYTNRIDLSEYDNGIYFIQFNANARSYITKVIKR